MAEFSDLRTWRPQSDGEDALAGPSSSGEGARAGASRGPQRLASRRPPGGSVGPRRGADDASMQITAPPPRLPLPSWIGAAFDRSGSRAPGARSQAPTVVPVPVGQGSGMPPDEGWELELSQLLEQADATIFHWQPPEVSPRSRSTVPARAPLSRSPRASGAPRARATNLGPLRREPPRPNAGERRNAPPEAGPSASAALSALPSLGPATLGFRAPVALGADARGGRPVPRPNLGAGRAAFEGPSAAAASINVSPTHSSSELVGEPSLAAPAYADEALSAPPYVEGEAVSEPAYGPDEAVSEPASAEVASPSEAAPAEKEVEVEAAPSFGPGSGRRAPPPLPDPSSEPAILLSTFPPPPSSLMPAADDVGSGDYLDPEAGELGEPADGEAQDEAPAYVPGGWSPADASRMPGPPRRPTFGAVFATEMLAGGGAEREGREGSPPRGGGAPGGDVVLKDPFPAAPGPRAGSAEAAAEGRVRGPAEAAAEGRVRGPAEAAELTDDEIALVHGRTLWSRLTRRRR